MNRLIEKVIKSLEENKKILGGIMGVEFNFTPGSIQQLEKALDAMYPFGRKLKPEVMIMLGVYLGETIRRTIPNAEIRWGDEAKYAIDNELLVEKIEIDGQMNNTSFSIKPILRLEKFLHEDRTDSLWAMYALCSDLCSGEVKVNENFSEEWKNTSNGYRFRIRPSKQ